MSNETGTLLLMLTCILNTFSVHADIKGKYKEATNIRLVGLFIFILALMTIEYV